MNEKVTTLPIGNEQEYYKLRGILLEAIPIGTPILLLLRVMMDIASSFTSSLPSDYIPRKDCKCGCDE